MGCIWSKRERAMRTGRERGTRSGHATLPSKTELRVVEQACNEYGNDPANTGDTTEPQDVDITKAQYTYQEIPDSLVKTVWMPSVKKKETYSLVIAIDFGTTYSAYAYAHLRDKLDIMVNKNWESQGSAASFKTPTCLCVKENDPTKIHYFGLDAQRHYNEDENTRLKLFEQFKMKLYAANLVNRDMTIDDKDRTISVRGLEIFAMAIKFLKDHCLEHIKEAGYAVEDKSILWVLTVPAIWKDVQKMFMREAAVKAGIIQDIADRNLMIALEPEAAAVYCRSVYNTNASPHAPAVPTGNRGRNKYTELQPGDKFMVIDSGGGTVDITAYQCLGDGKCKEIISPVGAAYGGKLVNENFIELLNENLGKDFMEHLSKANPSALFDMMLNFEAAKRQCTANLDKDISVVLPQPIFDTFKDFTRKGLDEHFRDISVKTELKLRNGKVKIPPALQPKLFEPVVRNIVKLVSSTAKRAEIKELTIIYLVGGFGQCAYLESQLRQSLISLRPNVHLLKPEEPSLCVLRGAVMCGANPMLIDSRIAPRTYLIAAVNPDHTTVLATVITKGQSIPHGFLETKFVEPESAALTYVTLSLYATERDPPHKLGDMGMIKVCQVDVKCTCAEGQDNLVQFDFMFGGTEIEITGLHSASKTKIKAKVDFLCPS